MPDNLIQAADQRAKVRYDLRMEIRKAGEHDRDVLERLVRSVALPSEGLQDQFPNAYWVALRDGDAVGCVGLERYGDFGLLRSLAVAEHARGLSLGTRLLFRALEDAGEARLGGVFLLTTTASEFFVRHGFKHTARADTPAAIREAPEFKSICPSSADCLVWTAE